MRRDEIAARVRHPAGKCINSLEKNLRGDELIVSCWCERTLGLISKKDAWQRDDDEWRSITFSCGHWDCRP